MKTWRVADTLKLARFAQSSLPIAGAVAIKLSSAGLSFLLILVIARTSGAAVTGSYAMAIVTANMAALVATFGLDHIMVRNLGGDLRESRLAAAWAVLRTTVNFVLPLAIVCALALFALSSFAPLIGATSQAMAIAALSVPAFPMLRIAVLTLRAMGSVLLSQFLDGMAHTMLILLLVLATLLVSGEVNSATLTGFYAGGLILMASIAWGIVLRRTRSWPRSATCERNLIGAGWPLLVAALAQTFTPWFLLAFVGAYVGAPQVGAYRVASQFGMIISLALTTIEALVNPQLAGDFRLGDNKSAWSRHRRATVLMIGSAAAPIAACLIFPRELLRLFGPEFVQAAPALIIIACAHVVNVVTGPIGGVMVMSGHERLSLRLAISGMIIGVVTAWLLIPTYGLIGAALANGAALAFRNIAALIVMRRLLPIAKVGIGSECR